MNASAHEQGGGGEAGGRRTRAAISDEAREGMMQDTKALRTQSATRKFDNDALCPSAFC